MIDGNTVFQTIGVISSAGTSFFLHPVWRIVSKVILVRIETVRKGIDLSTLSDLNIFMFPGNDHTKFLIRKIFINPKSNSPAGGRNNNLSL